MGSHKVGSVVQRVVQRVVQWSVMSAITLITLHIISTLLLAVLGLAPGSTRWSLLLTFAGVLAVSGSTIGLQAYLIQQKEKGQFNKLLYVLAGALSGVASGAVLGFFVGGQLGNQQTIWAGVGLAIGSVCFGSLAMWAYRQRATHSSTGGSQFARVCRRMTLLISGLCAYGLAFGLGAWSWMAIGTGRVGLAVLLGLLTALYLWMTRQAIFLFRTETRLSPSSVRRGTGSGLMERSGISHGYD